MGAYVFHRSVEGQKLNARLRHMRSIQSFYKYCSDWAQSTRLKLGRIMIACTDKMSVAIKQLEVHGVSLANPFDVPDSWMLREQPTAGGAASASAESEVAKARIASELLLGGCGQLPEGGAAASIADVIQMLEDNHILPEGSACGPLLALCDSIEFSGESDGCRPILRARCPEDMAQID